MAQALARHGQEVFGDVVGAAGKGHGGPARRFLIKQAPDGIDSLAMGDVARDGRMVPAEDPGWVGPKRVVPAGMRFALETGDCARKASKQSFLSSEGSLGVSSIELASLRMTRGTTR